MSRRSRSQRSQRRSIKARPKRQSRWPAVAFVFGLIVACFAIFLLELTGRTLFFWLFRDDYIRTELKVTSISPGWEEQTIVSGIVAATGEKVHLHRIPTELVHFDSPSDPTGTVMDHMAVRGKVIPIWFAEDHDSFFSSARVHYVSEFKTMPSGKLVLGIATVNLAILAAAVWYVVVGIRRYNARGRPTDNS